MKFIGAVIIIALFLLGGFLLANWDTLTTPTRLSFLFFEAHGPVGLIFLGVTLVFVALFTSYALILRTTMLMEARRYSQELVALRKLAEGAENSRIDQLREQITLEFARLHTANQDIQTSFMNRSESLEQSLRKSLDETTNSLSACVGEVEEKLDRVITRITA